MCKKLRFCSTLIIASLVTSCGYDDGQGELLPILPLTCTSSMDCKIGTEVIGECISGSCQRFCDSRDDCEPNTICESGVCRPIMDCPALQFNDEVVISYTDSAQVSQTMSVDNRAASAIYANRKCLQVFSHTPQTSWRTLFKKDLVLDKNNLNKSSNDDFTSDDFTFTIPQDALYTGVNFSGVTFMSLVYMVILQMGYEYAAQCFKPEIYDPISNKFNPLDSYLGKYLYPVQELALGDTTSLLSLCSGSVAGMSVDMQKYLTYYKVLAEGETTVDDWNANVNMDQKEFNHYNLATAETSKQACKSEDKEAHCFKGVCDCGEDSACTWCKDNVRSILNLKENDTLEGNTIPLEDGSKSSYEYYYEYVMPSSGFSKAKMLELAYNDYLKMIDTKESCNGARQFLSVLIKVSSILMEIGTAEGTKCATTTATEALIKTLMVKTPTKPGENYSYEDPATHFTKFTEISDASNSFVIKPVAMCDSKLSNAIISNNDALYTQYGDAYQSNDAYIPYCNREELDCGQPLSGTCKPTEANTLDATLRMMTQFPMENQVNTCIYGLYGLSTFPLTQAFATSSDMQVGKCADHERVVSSMLDASKLSSSSLRLHEAMETLLFNESAGQTQITLDMLYANYINPKYLWLSGTSLAPMRISTKSERFNKNDLILENQFKPNENIFLPSADSTISVPLTTDIGINIFPDMFIEKSMNTVGYPTFAFSSQNAEQEGAFVSSYSYEKAKAGSIVSGAALYQRSLPGACPNNVCSFYHHAQKIGNTSGMICGGISYEVESFNGYIVLTQDDINQYGGTGVLVSDKTNP